MRTFILTGGSDGLGKAFGNLCIAKGYKIVCLSRSQPDYEAHHIPTDLADPTSIATAIEKISKYYSSFSALINCAGVFSQQKSEALTFEELQRVFTVNTLAPIFIISQLLNLIKHNEADILNVGSTASTKALADQYVYGASKWGLRGATYNFQLELKSTRCRAIQFNPGGFKSDFFKKYAGQSPDLSGYMETNDLAQLMLMALELPKSMEVSEIVINRKS